MEVHIMSCWVRFEANKILSGIKYEVHIRLFFFAKAVPVIDYTVCYDTIRYDTIVFNV